MIRFGGTLTQRQLAHPEASRQRIERTYRRVDDIGQRQVQRQPLTDLCIGKVVHAVISDYLDKDGFPNRSERHVDSVFEHIHGKKWSRARSGRHPRTCPQDAHRRGRRVWRVAPVARMALAVAKGELAEVAARLPG